MKHKTDSPEYETQRLGWPKNLGRECPFCEGKLKFWGSDNGKLVYTLAGDINQVMNLYQCLNPDCYLHEHPFNPHPRFDYGARTYGADVFRLIAEEFLLVGTKASQILYRLIKKGVDISERTVERICDDVLNLKAFQIDKRTRELLAENPYVVLGLDGQDPGKGGKALWLFIDVIKGRVLHTRVVESMDHVQLHAIIEMIKVEFHVEYAGFVSDKQGCITACMEKFYPALPHQYCQFHFLNNTWKHAAALDSNVYLPLRKTINGLYIHSASKNTAVHFEGVGNLPVREVFKDVDGDLQVMVKARNKTFKELRGIWLYEKLSTYVDKMDALAREMDPSFRFAIIFTRTTTALRASLEEVKDKYEEACLLFQLFGSIRENIKDPDRDWLDQQESLDGIYAHIWTMARERGLTKDFDELRAFLPSKDKPLPEILGEWRRLWESYRPGLFQYINFPETVRTNNKCEGGFGTEKQKIYARAAKKQVGYLVETRGEAYLRLAHCEPDELEADVLADYTDVLAWSLRDEQDKKIGARTKYWRKKNRVYEGCETSIARFYPKDEEERE